MAYRKIEEIVVNGNSGEIFDSYIYGSNLQLGFSESPTKLTLNIVKKDSSDFTSFPNSLLNSYEIKVGNLTLSKMYLYGYEISKSVGQKVATLNFLDGSFILDKIFVGLINRHGGAPEAGTVQFSVPAKCLSCDGSQIIDVTGSTTRSISSGLIIDVDLKKGGSIILGQEQFVQGQCDIPDVAYNFTQLLDAISKSGINISNFVDVNPNYFQSYVGTLREVLSNWCADFGYTFYWDFRTNSIKGIDLKIEVDFISQIKSIIDTNSSLNVNATNENTLAIESFNESESLEGTSTQKHISRYLKPFRTKSSSSSVTNTRTFNCIKPEKLKVSNYDVTRAILGKYSPAARNVYAIMNNDYEPLGYTALSSFETIEKGQVNDNFWTKIYDYGYNNPAITDFIAKYNGAQVFVALYDPDKLKLYQDWEAAIADMIGKYYEGANAPSIDSRSCSTSLFAERKTTINPTSEIYTNKNKYDLPFAKVIEGPIPENSGIEWNIPTFYLFSRSTAYGTTQDEYDKAMLDDNKDDPFLKYKEAIQDLDGLGYVRLDGAKNTAECVGDTKLAEQANKVITLINNLKDSNVQDGQRKVVFVFLPPKGVLNKIMQVTTTTMKNTKEVVKGQENSEKSSECITVCEADLLQQVCGKCPDQNTPFVGLNSPTARTVSLIYNGERSINLIAPAETPYYGYETVSSSVKFTVPGQKLVFGNINDIDDNTLSLHVAESDITNDLDPVDGSTIINMFVPDGATKNFKTVTPAQYHADLSKKIVNSVTSPRKNLSLSIIGLNFGDLVDYISPDKGLTSFSINLNENGATSQISFANRPKVLPKREAIAQKIQPTIKLNTYRPT